MIVALRRQAKAAAFFVAKAIHRQLDRIVSPYYGGATHHIEQLHEWQREALVREQEDATAIHELRDERDMWRRLFDNLNRGTPQKPGDPPVCPEWVHHALKKARDERHAAVLGYSAAQRSLAAAHKELERLKARNKVWLVVHSGFDFYEILSVWSSKHEAHRQALRLRNERWYEARDLALQGRRKYRTEAELNPHYVVWVDEHELHSPKPQDP